MTIITSQQNERVKLIRALQTAPKTRRIEGKVVLEGARLIADAMDSGAQPLFALYTADSTEHAATAALHSLLETAGVELFEVAPDLMEYVSDTQSPQGVLAVFPMPKLDVPNTVSFALILDGIADPGNLGTILRTAAGGGVDVVILAPASVDAFNPKVLRGGMGAHFRLPIRRLTWAEIADHYGQHMPIYLAEANAETPYTSVDWKQPAALLIGGEAHGPDATARTITTQPIAIPMASGAESLNAAVAAAVIVFEARRQRGS